MQQHKRQECSWRTWARTLAAGCSPIRTDGTVGWFQAVRGATALKRAHDPGNRFAYNHNIKPAPVERA
jgi:hypothetical protein